jgi:hypothetical protein
MICCQFIAKEGKMDDAAHYSAIQMSIARMNCWQMGI